MDQYSVQEVTAHCGRSVGEIREEAFLFLSFRYNQDATESFTESLKLNVLHCIQGTNNVF